MSFPYPLPYFVGEGDHMGGVESREVDMDLDDGEVRLPEEDTQLNK